MTDEIENVAIMSDPNEVVRFVCIDGVIRKAYPDELQNILDFEQISIRDTLDSKINISRLQRNKLLADSDWVELPSAIARLSAEELSAWATYRQALRDIPAQDGFPNEIVWPTSPTEST